MSPVGADAWYSSALLTTLILQGVVNKNDNLPEQPDIFPRDRIESIDIAQPKPPLRVLELGSGAKGLPGFAAAVTLSFLSKRFPSWTVTMTDNNTDCLAQLKLNVESNRHKILPIDTDEGDREINVDFLDWGDDLYGDNSRLLNARVVIGSELVYTSETAHALVDVLSALL
ncbi:MAG: hypothetical protein SGARI_005698, partial [Bacillariaceae sp.]